MGEHRWSEAAIAEAMATSPLEPKEQIMTLEQELTAVLNRHSAENGSNTPDYILAEYLKGCLAAFDVATRRREDWYGCRHSPGGVPSPQKEGKE